MKIYLQTVPEHYVCEYPRVIIKYRPSEKQQAQEMAALIAEVLQIKQEDIDE